MKKPLIYLVAFCIIAAFIVAFIATYLQRHASDEAAQSTPIEATLISHEGEGIGTVRIEGTHEGILLRIKATDLPPGYHGMHFHQVGDCNHQEYFHTAQGHVMPKNKPHGFKHAQGPHAGNLPNLVVHEDGSVEVELYSSLVALRTHPHLPSLLDDDGSALIIHVDEDDHLSQPIGGSGARIACAVLPAN